MVIIPFKLFFKNIQIYNTIFTYNLLYNHLGIAFENQVTPVNTILYFECKPETLVERLLGRAKTSGRADDNEETIKLRLNTFNANNDQVLALYPDRLKRVSNFFVIIFVIYIYIILPRMDSDDMFGS